MEFQPYKANECFENLYYKVPMELFLNPMYSLKLSSDSKLLYGFLLNRLDLSIKNQWLDEDGNIYLIYARKDIEKLLNVSDKTVTKAFKELADCKLIYEKKQGRGKPNLIYVGKIIHMKSVNRNISDSRNGKNTILESENLRPNYINNNYKYKGNKPSNCYAMDNQYTEEFLNSFYMN